MINRYNLVSSVMHTMELRYYFPVSDKQRVYEHLSDLNKFASVHPYMTSVSMIGSKAGTVNEYRIEETFRIGRIPCYKPSYKIQVTEPVQGQLHYYSNVKWNIHLDIDFHFSETEEQLLLVTEQIMVKGNPLIVFPFLRILRSAHRATMLRLKQAASV